jgi:hypothetical protein
MPPPLCPECAIFAALYSVFAVAEVRSTALSCANPAATGVPETML